MRSSSDDRSGGSSDPEVRPDPTSRARDHLANERTYLAWLRTALGFVGLGVIVAELVDVEGTEARTAGVAFIVAGMAVVGYASARFRAQGRRLDEGRFRAAVWGPMLIGAALVLVAVGALVFVLD